MLRFLHWKSLFRRKQFESGMAEEFAFHQEARRHDLIRQGLSPEEACRRVALEFGAVQRYSEECRQAHRLRGLTSYRSIFGTAFEASGEVPVFLPLP